MRLAEIGDLARHGPAGAYHQLSCRTRGLLPWARTGDDNDAERDFRRRRSTEMMKT
jgi:hypothetical protein